MARPKIRLLEERPDTDRDVLDQVLPAPDEKSGEGRPVTVLGKGAAQVRPIRLDE